MQLLAVPTCGSGESVDILPAKDVTSCGVTDTPLRPPTLERNAVVTQSTVYELSELTSLRLECDG